MQFKSLTPNLMVEDVTETVDWYRTVFDAEVVARLPPDEEHDPWWSQILIGDVSLMFQERANMIEKIPSLEGESVGGTSPIFITVDDAHVLSDRLASAEVSVVQSLHETEFGWLQFAVSDPNGYVLWFGEKLTPDRMGPVVP